MDKIGSRKIKNFNEATQEGRQLTVYLKGTGQYPTY